MRSMPPPQAEGRYEYHGSGGMWATFAKWQPPAYQATPRLWTGHSGHRKCFNDLNEWRKTGDSSGTLPTKNRTRPLWLAAGKSGTTLSCLVEDSRQDKAKEVRAPFVRSLETARTLTQTSQVAISLRASQNFGSRSAPSLNAALTEPPRIASDPTPRQRLATTGEIFNNFSAGNSLPPPPGDSHWNRLVRPASSSSALKPQTNSLANSQDMRFSQSRAVMLGGSVKSDPRGYTPPTKRCSSAPCVVGQHFSALRRPY